MGATQKAKVGFLGGLAIAIGNSIGGGLWATPVVAAAIAGPTAVLLMVLIAVPMFLAFPTFFTLSKAWPVSPGSYYYITRMLLPENKAISQLIGWTAVWGALSIGGFFYLQYMVVAGASFLHILVPTVSTELFTAFLLTFSFVTVWFGFRVAGYVEIILASMLLLSIAVIIGFGIFHISLDSLTPVMPNGFLESLPAYAILFSLGAGAVYTIDFGGDIDDAENTIDKIIFTGGVLDVLSASTVALVVVGVASYTQLEGKTLTFVVNQFLPGNLIFISGIGALLAGITTNIASIAMFDRYYMAVADDNILPQWAGQKNKHGEPVILLLFMYIGSMITVFVDVPLSAVAASFAFFFVVNLSLVLLVGFRLPTQFPEIFENKHVKKSRFLRPRIVRWSSLGAILITFGMIIFLSLSEKQAFMWYLLFLTSGILIYAFRWWQIENIGDLIPSQTKYDDIRADEMHVESSKND